MAQCILADSWRQPARADDGLLMTTTHAARFLGVGLETMRRLGLTGVVPSVPTSSPRIRLFKKGVLRRVLDDRAEARVRWAQRRLTEVHPVMLKAGLKPRQFDLFGPKLRIVRSCQKASRGDLPTTTTRTFGKSGGSNNRRYGNQPAAGGRR
jgi:hypothetical protein